MMTAVTSALSFFVAVVAAVEIVLGVVEAALAVFEGTLVPGKAHVAISAIAHAPSLHFSCKCGCLGLGGCCELGCLCPRLD